MIEMLDGSLVGWRSTGAWIGFHSPSAVNAQPVPSSEFVFDVGRNAEAVRHRRVIVRLMATDGRYDLGVSDAPDQLCAQRRWLPQRLRRGIFASTRGKPTDELDCYKRPVKVTLASFARHAGIDE